jgi:hypothetical protein
MPRWRAQEGQAYIFLEKLLVYLESICFLIEGSVTRKPRKTTNVFHLGTILPQKPQFTVDSCPFDFVCR